jgi:hypothetical protein
MQKSKVFLICLSVVTLSELALANPNNLPFPQRLQKQTVEHKGKVDSYYEYRKQLKNQHHVDKKAIEIMQQRKEKLAQEREKIRLAYIKNRKPQVYPEDTPLFQVHTKNEEKRLALLEATRVRYVLERDKVASELGKLPQIPPAQELNLEEN